MSQNNTKWNNILENIVSFSPVAILKLFKMIVLQCEYSATLVRYMSSKYYVDRPKKRDGKHNPQGPNLLALITFSPQKRQRIGLDSNTYVRLVLPSLLIHSCIRWSVNFFIICLGQVPSL